MKDLIILGSTGSIGTQSLEVAREQGYSVSGLVAGSNIDLLEKQAREWKPKTVAVFNEQSAKDLKLRLADTDVKVLSGSEGVCDVAQGKGDTVINAIVGIAGLKPTLSAIESGKTIALANKETLVTGGEIVNRKAKEKGVKILPVDSEHSAIFQSLVGEDMASVEKLLLTASGGPFRTFTFDQMQHVTASQALQHPNWEMGAKITIDSASMMNKGFEVIEARWLFDIPVEKIQVLVHPQSVIHSAVQFVDGSVKAQLGTPDMRMPIQYALTYPERWLSDVPRLDLFKTNNLTFEEPDLQRFPNLRLAYQAMEQGGNMPCILNAANEVVNLAFREGRCGFLQMSDIIEQTMTKTTFITEPTYDNYVQTDAEARRIAIKLINS